MTLNRDLMSGDHGPGIAPLHRACACKVRCTEVPEADDHPYAICKGLPLPPREPLVEVVLVDRRAG